MALACRREEDSQCEPIVQAKKYSAPTAASDGTVQVAGEVEELVMPVALAPLRSQVPVIDAASGIARTLWPPVQENLIVLPAAALAERAPASEKPAFQSIAHSSAAQAQASARRERTATSERGMVLWAGGGGGVSAPGR